MRCAGALVDRLWLVLLVALGCLAGCGADSAVPSPWLDEPSLPLDLRITVEPREVGLLAPVRVTLDRYRKQGVEVAFAPKLDDKVFLTKVSETSDERPFGDGLWQRTTMILLPIDGPRELTIPSFRAETVVAEGQEPQVATTPTQTITVTTTLSAEHGAEIEAPGDPFPTPFAGWWWLIGAVLLVGLIATGIWWRSRNQSLQPHAAIIVPAHVKALRELARWRNAKRETPEEIDAFYVAVSQVLRVYLEERFGLHAPEQTTEEFLRDLDGSAALIREYRAELQGFLTQCDMVKFARFVPPDAEHDKAYQLAEALIESTRIDRVGDAQGVDSHGGQPRAGGATASSSAQAEVLP